VSAGPLTFGRRVAQLAQAHPGAPAIIFVPEGSAAGATLTWAQLHAAVWSTAQEFARRGVTQASWVAVGLPNSTEHYVATLAAWRLGACVLPVSPRLPAPERDGILTLAQPILVAAEWGADTSHQAAVIGRAEIARWIAGPTAVDSSPDRVAAPGKAICSGGSTGRPKIIVDPTPWEFVPGETPISRVDMGVRAGQVQLVGGALFHNTPFSWSYFGLFEDHTLVVMERFDAERALQLIERYHVNFSAMVPTMMARMLRVEGLQRYDLSRVESIVHTAAPCPAWVKRGWIELIGGEKVHEGFGSTESVGHVKIRGDEWLAHPGSVGRAHNTALKIVDEHGAAVGAGMVGEIFMKPAQSTPTYYYKGSPPAKTDGDGFVSVGDMGWLDAEGYLYIADRRVDLIITGGVNVYPAEVEAVLSEHPAVDDVIVIGLPDADWGKRVHALVHTRGDRAVTAADLDAFARSRLQSVKVPKSWEFVSEFPRDPAGKIRRSALVTERAIPEVSSP
jgi:bile acid-coenzyme A ligase